ncbi:MAG: hypothetical protein ACI4UN_00720 [Muribaculaceae bacterium]
MRKYLLACAALMLAGSQWASAIESPYEGSDVGADDFNGGTFYLYNVESGKWLQENNRHQGIWVAHAETGDVGLDFNVIVQGEALHFQLDPKFGNNHSLLAASLMCDWGEPASIWVATPVEGAGANVYTLTCTEGENTYTLGIDDNGYLTNLATAATEWQFVSPAERLDVLKANASAENPLDATWLVPAATFNGAANERMNSWIKSRNTSCGLGGEGNECNYNHVFEAWQLGDFSIQQTVDVPDGNYRITASGFYSPCDAAGLGSQGADRYVEYEAGTLANCATFFAGDQEVEIPSIFSSAQSERIDGMFTRDLGVGLYVPEHIWQMSNAIMNGHYRFPEPLNVAVTGGKLNIGAMVTGAPGGAWFGIDQISIEYLGNNIDINVYKEQLAKAIADAKAILADTDMTDVLRATLEDAVTAAEAVYNNESASQEEIAAAIAQLAEPTVVILQLEDAVKNLRATFSLAEAEGVTEEVVAGGMTVMDLAKLALQYATNSDDLNNALNALRVARRIKASEKSEMIYEKAVAEVGDFYLYNVGQKRWFCGGNSWGAHASLGFPGIEITLEENNGAFSIRTHLNNGVQDGVTPLEYLNWSGYCDTPWLNDTWAFTETQDGSGIYLISKTLESESDQLLGYENGSYNNVITTDTDKENPNNQWILVKKSSRLALLDGASAENPVDATINIVMPGFSQREGVTETGEDKWESIWQHVYGGIWGRGGDHGDFVFESWNDPETQLGQSISGLKPGFYTLSVQGYYRDREPNAFADNVAAGNEPNLYSFAFAADFDNDIEVAAAIPSLAEAANGVPGIGLNTSIGRIPDSCDEAVQFFQTGYLWVTTEPFEVKEGANIMIGMIKYPSEGILPTDWTVVDNFRLTYYGTTDPSGVEETVTKPVRKGDGKIYNIMGVEVKDMEQHGFYIVDGQKILK